MVFMLFRLGPICGRGIMHIDGDKIAIEKYTRMETISIRAFNSIMSESDFVFTQYAHDLC